MPGCSTDDDDDDDKWSLSKCGSSRGIKSLGFILDGNGRWGTRTGNSRLVGHTAGARNAKQLVQHCGRIGIECLYLYVFSTENWKRPPDEVAHIFALLPGLSEVTGTETPPNNEDAMEMAARKWNMAAAGTEMSDHTNGWKIVDQEEARAAASELRLIHLGSRTNLPETILRVLDEAVEKSKGNRGMVVALCFNYGGREEICFAAERLLREMVQEGVNQWAKSKERTEVGVLSDVSAFAASLKIDETMITRRLYGKGEECGNAEGMGQLRDPDLIIRTGGEMRLSNFLIWQSAYSEFYYSKKLFPDFGAEDMDEAFLDFESRTRKFGACCSRQAETQSGNGDGDGDGK